MKASESWWKLLALAVLVGFAGLDGVVGIVGKEAPSGTIGRALAGVLVIVSIILAALGLTAGLIRFIKWTWKD
jgi:hypothetical protein